MPIPSCRPEVEVPKDEPIWSWLFDSRHSAVTGLNSIKGFRDPASGEFISYTDARTLSTYLSTSFARDFQVAAGDCISIFCNNSVWYPVALFAAFRLGAVVAAASPAYTKNEMIYALQNASPKMILVDQASFPVACEAAEALNLPRKSLVLLDRAVISGCPNVSDLTDSGRNRGASQVPKWTFRDGHTAANTCALLCFSSGTTGLPKAVRISHENIIAQCCQMKSLRAPGPTGVLLSPLPLFHITGLVQIMILPAHINQEVIIMAKFNMKDMLDAIVKYKSNELWLVPPILIRLINEPLVPKYNLKHIKQFNTGAAPLSPEVIQKLAGKFPGVGIKQGWGMTESTSCITSTPPELLHYRYAHTVGVAVPNTVLKIVNPETGEEVGANVPGEILAKGPQVSMGYKDNPKATMETYDDDGFLHTGDLGSIDEKGVVTIHDRIKELIKVRGTGVAPAELEGLLLSHPLVRDAAVTGIPSSYKYSGEIPRAFIVLQAGIPREDQTAEVLKEFVKSRCSRPKWLDGGVVFLHEIPKSASGKILRRVLRDGEGGGKKIMGGGEAKL
ncbi:hypothetical protein BKA61DRAFT_645348 [Leptodontidium sp. MPI-SDFR-AT-0119]|nr:hypothetical protein BKA61DRAFT_645348 [Leptodontidium sp. MPI-SDFR-AT-0119]